MPVVLDRRPVDQQACGTITIGLINNMPDEALKTTERQYISLLESVSDGLDIHLSFYTLPGVSRSETINRHIARLYSNIDDLWDGQVDGLIVTGREPLAQSLAEEPYWESFTRTLAWAQENAESTIWSCLAAHAAVLHMDGIERVKRDDKFFGIFECRHALDHPLLAGIAAGFRLPHSRWNGLSEPCLTACGYSVLTRTADGEIDTFIRQQKKLFVFFQGHPEYDCDTLLREYRRDITRYLRGVTSKYPSIPQGYFDATTTNALLALQERTHFGPGEALLPEVAVALGSATVANTWHATASSLYTNWLHYLQAEKEKRSEGVVNGSRFAGTLLRQAVACDSIGN